MSSGDVWVHDARLRPSLSLETEFCFPEGDGDGEIRRTTRVVIDEPSQAIIQDAFERFRDHIKSDDE